MCGNSDRALEALREAGAPVTTVDILPDPRFRQELRRSSGWPTIPQVFVQGELIGGADIVEELAAIGELEQKLSTRSAPTTAPSRPSESSPSPSAPPSAPGSGRLCPNNSLTGPQADRSGAFLAEGRLARPGGTPREARQIRGCTPELSFQPPAPETPAPRPRPQGGGPRGNQVTPSSWFPSDG